MVHEDSASGGPARGHLGALTTGTILDGARQHLADLPLIHAVPGCGTRPIFWMGTGLRGGAGHHLDARLTLLALKILDDAPQVVFEGRSVGVAMPSDLFDDLIIDRVRHP